MRVTMRDPMCMRKVSVEDRLTVIARLSTRHRNLAQLIDTSLLLLLLAAALGAGSAEAYEESLFPSSDRPLFRSQSDLI